MEGRPGGANREELYPKSGIKNPKTEVLGSLQKTRTEVREALIEGVEPVLYPSILDTSDEIEKKLTDFDKEK